MEAMAAPLPADNVDAWRAWTGELKGARNAEFEASNARHQLSAHNAWLQANPDGNYVVIVVQDGPGAAGYLGSMAQSEDPFDQWFLSNVVSLHGMDLSAGPPPLAERGL